MKFALTQYADFNHIDAGPVFPFPDGCGNRMPRACSYLRLRRPCVQSGIHPDQHRIHRFGIPRHQNLGGQFGRLHQIGLIPGGIMPHDGVLTAVRVGRNRLENGHAIPGRHPHRGHTCGGDPSRGPLLGKSVQHPDILCRIGMLDFHGLCIQHHVLIRPHRYPRHKQKHAQQSASDRAPPLFHGNPSLSSFQ